MKAPYAFSPCSRARKWIIKTLKHESVQGAHGLKDLQQLIATILQNFKLMEFTY
jgi:hypothetical protein